MYTGPVATNSEVVSGMDPIKVADPTFSPVAGSYTGTQLVTISTTTSGASIRYTTNGGTPSPTSGTVYTTPVSFASSLALKAIAVVAPAFSPVAGSYTGTQNVTITSGTSGACTRVLLR